MSGDVCIVDVSSFNLFTNVVMLNANVFCPSMKRLVMGQVIGPNVVAVNAGWMVLSMT